MIVMLRTCFLLVVEFFSVDLTLFQLLTLRRVKNTDSEVMVRGDTITGSPLAPILISRFPFGDKLLYHQHGSVCRLYHRTLLPVVHRLTL